MFLKTTNLLCGRLLRPGGQCAGAGASTSRASNYYAIHVLAVFFHCRAVGTVDIARASAHVGIYVTGEAKAP